MKLNLSWTLIVLFLFVLALDYSPIARDDTDPGAWGERSGLALRVDSLTGCQYLAVFMGGITPRVDGKGNHVGCKE